ERHPGHRGRDPRDVHADGYAGRLQRVEGPEAGLRAPRGHRGDRDADLLQADGAGQDGHGRAGRLRQAGPGPPREIAPPSAGLALSWLSVPGPRLAPRLEVACSVTIASPRAPRPPHRRSRSLPAPFSSLRWPWGPSTAARRTARGPGATRSR